jgi:hypothetical protein
VNYFKTSEKVFSFFTFFYFINVFVTIGVLGMFKKRLQKIVEMFPGVWCLILALEIIYFIGMVCLKIFYKETYDSRIYLSDIFVFILSTFMVSCHYCWYFLRGLVQKG